MLTLVAAAISVHDGAAVTPESFDRMGWSVQSARPVAEEKVAFTVSLSLRNMEELKRRALAVSTPGDATYGQFMTTRQIDELTSPSSGAVKRVEAWLLEHDVSTYEVSRENVFVSTSVAKASALLDTSFLKYNKDGRSITRAMDYTLPSSVAEVTATTFGLHGLPMPRAEPLNMTLGNNNDADPPAVTPAVIYETYKINKPYINQHGTNRQAVAEFQGQYMSKQDLAKFFKKEVPHFKKGEQKVDKFVGVPYTKGDGVEAELDIEFIMGTAPGVKTDFFEWPENDFCSDLHQYTAKLLDSPDVLTNSISYGFQGSLDQLGCTSADVKTVDNNLAKLAAKGISVIISSGDSGSGYTSNNDDADFTLYASWPASSPWVTAVGATRFIGQKVGGGEMASDQFGSGGGFSTLFDQTHAKWQAAAVAKYVAKGSKLKKFPPNGSFAPLGRATPDVSALGEGFQVYVDGSSQPVGGTSASAPTFAGIVSLLNEARLKAGKKHMGFLNPFLYANPDAFNDIIKGTNAEGRDASPSPYGYECAAGWDAATGLGTPKFPKLLTAAMKAVGVSMVEEQEVA